MKTTSVVRQIILNLEGLFGSLAGFFAFRAWYSLRKKARRV